MDKFLTHQGQQPIWLGDFDFFDKAVRDTFANLVKFIAGNERVVFLTDPGIELFSPGDGLSGLKWNDTAVLLDGEILPMPAGQTSVSVVAQSKVFITVSRTYDDAGTRTMKSGDKVDCYEIRKASFVLDTESKEGYYEITSASVMTLDKIRSDYIRAVSPGEEDVAVLENYSDDTIRADLRIYKNRESYYIACEFVVKEQSTGILLTCEDIEVKAADLEKLVPHGISNISTHFPIVTTDGSYDYELYPARLDLHDYDDKLTIQVRLNHTLKLARNSRGSFFTRICLNTL